MNAQKHPNQQRDQHDHDPSAVNELRNDENQQHDEGCRSPNAVDDQILSPVRFARSKLRRHYVVAGICRRTHGAQTFSFTPPMHHHAGLRQGEREKHSDGIEWNEAARVTAKRPNQQTREDGQQHDPV